MVGYDSHGDIDFFLFGSGVGWRCESVFHSAKLFYFANDGLENVGVVVGVLALEHANETFESHSGIDNIHCQRSERTVGLTIELHKHDVPNLDDLRIILVHKLSTGYSAVFLFGRARVYVNLRTRSAGSGIAHFPKIIVSISVQNMVGRQVFSPASSSLFIAVNSFCRTSFEHGHI